jgi:hypothetical protein
MSDMQNFIEVPQTAQSFASRALRSSRTALAFIMDQRWASLIFLLVYLGLMYWDYQSVRLLPSPPPPDWTENWPEFLDPLKLQLARQGLGTWRSLLAAFVTLLYWGNALLYIADRSVAFPEEKVVGLGRYLLRGLTIAMLLALPMLIGFGLLIVPGLLVAAILIGAATIAMFREFGIFRAIGEGYRLVTRHLPGHMPVLGFSRSFIHITAAYALVILGSFLLAILSLGVAAAIERLFPAAGLALTYVQSTFSELAGSFLNLCFSIFVLSLYSEYRTLMRR